jgi:CRP/FNR family transcriptional regulator, cyclic AMP receptor protein
MQTIEPILAGHPFLKGLADDQLKLLVGCSANKVFKPGEFLAREGENADTFYFIREGTVQIEIFSPSHGPIVIQTLSGGEILGWSWIVPPYKWRFDAKASDTARVISLDGKCIREKCEKDHSLGFEMMKRFAVIIAERLEATRLQLLDIYEK